MPIRVLRVLEYVFQDADTAQRNMDNWVEGLSLPNMTMRSARITDLNWTSLPADGKEVKYGSESNAPDVQRRQDG